jgi:hypothetical protein
MAYFIFLKYMDSLEDFRKNPHVKIPPKSPCANFQSPGIFKNPIFIRKRTLLRFWPIQPALPMLARFARRLPGPRSAHSAQAALSYLPKGVFPLTLHIPATTPSLSHVTAMWAPTVSFIPFPTPADLTHITASSHRLRPPCTARPPTSRCPSKSSLSRLDSPI